MKRMFASLLAVCLVLTALCLPAMAAPNPSVNGTISVTESGQAASVPVQITTADDGALSFKVTLPARLPVFVDSHNQTYTATNAKITNLSAGPVTVTALALREAGGWDIVSYGTDLAQRPVGEKTLSMEINELPSTDGNSNGNHISYDRTVFFREFRETHNGATYLWAANYNPDTGIVTAHRNGSMAINYDVELAPQANALYSETAANAVFTVSFQYA